MAEWIEWLSACAYTYVISFSSIFSSLKWPDNLAFKERVHRKCTGMNKIARGLSRFRLDFKTISDRKR